jgi:hypothetical protein
MFTNDPRCVQIAPRVFKFENIIPKEIYDPIMAKASTFDKGSSYNAWSIRNWYENRMSPTWAETFPLWVFMSELIHPELVAHPVRNLMVTDNTDEGMFVHSDSPGKGQCDRLVEIDNWSTCCELEYGMIAYLGDFTGGELYYPNINPDGTEKTGDMRIDEKKLAEPCLVVPVNAGDIVFHGACTPYDHGTKPTTSGTRFAFSNFILLAEDNPGTFYNYKTPEWYEQIGDASEERLQNWMQPLIFNQQFADIVAEVKEKERRHFAGENTDIATPAIEQMRTKIDN